MKKISEIRQIIKTVKSLPTVEIKLDNSEEGNQLYSYFNSRHPKFLFLKRKKYGVGLIHMKEFTSPEAYIKSVNGKNSAAYFSRKALSKNCRFEQIDPNNYVNEIHEIHVSAKSRQGREIDDSYQSIIETYPLNSSNFYFGIFTDDKLVAYLWIVMSGDLLLMNRIMGHSNFLDLGIMYLLVTEFVQFSFSLNSNYIMYDTMLGGSEGLKMFKKRCGFKPCNVNWKKLK